MSELRNWIAEFLHSLKAELNYPANTVNSYRFDLQQFTEHLGGKQILAASSRDVAAFISSRLDSGISPRSARRQLSAIKSFYGFVLSGQGLERDPTRFLRGPKAHYPVVRPVTVEEVEKLLAATGDQTALDLRNRAMLLVAYGSGVRVTELTEMLISDVNLERGVAKVSLGKGQKDRFVPLNPREIAAIRLYLEKGRPKLAGKKPQNELLFIGSRCRQLTRQRVWQVFVRISKAVLGRKTSPHKFRHAFVTDTINGGAEPRVVQRMVGHSYLGTTMLYMHSDIERVRRHYLAAHPLTRVGGSNA